MCRVYNSQKIGTGKMDSIPPAFPTKTAMPRNCLHPCCYGRGRDYCFPCYKKLKGKNEKYREITPLSRQLYGLLRYRTCLAEKYGWEDEKGRRYIYCTIRQISEELGCSVRTTGKLITELQEKGFLEKERQGQGKPNRIYLKGPGESFPGRKERNE